jgi:hypothetical protein
MSHAGETEFRRGIKLFLVKAVEKSGGGGPIKTTVVKTEPDAGHVVAMVPFSFLLALSRKGQSLLGWRDKKKKSSGNKLWREGKTTSRGSLKRETNSLPQSKAGWDGLLPYNALCDTGSDGQFEELVLIRLDHQQNPQH